MAPQMVYPRIAGARFGQVTVGDEVHAHDVVIRASGKVKKRKKSLAKAAYGTSHRIGPRELEKVCKGRPERLIIGTGQSGAATLTPEGAAYLRERAIAVTALPTPEAIEAFNRAPGPKAALIHVTC